MRRRILNFDKKKIPLVCRKFCGSLNFLSFQPRSFSYSDEQIWTHCRSLCLDDLIRKFYFFFTFKVQNKLFWEFFSFWLVDFVFEHFLYAFESSLQILFGNSHVKFWLLFTFEALLFSLWLVVIFPSDSMNFFR
jgi:hypothetical protein